MESTPIRQAVWVARRRYPIGAPTREESAINRSAGMSVVRGVGLYDGVSISVELQELLLEQFGKAVYSCGDERTCETCLRMRTAGGLSSERGGVFKRGRQRSVRFEVAKVVRRTVLSEVVSGFDDSGGKSGEDVSGNAVDSQGGVRPARLPQSQSCSARTRLRWRAGRSGEPRTRPQ